MNDIWKEKYEQLRQEEIERLTTEIARLKLEISQREFNQKILVREPAYYPVNFGYPCESYYFKEKKNDANTISSNT